MAATGSSETFRAPGQHAYSQARAISGRVLVIVVVAVVVPVALITLFGVSGRPMIAIALVAIGAIVGADRYYGPKADRWLRGADGERDVARVLAGLEADGWLTLHDVSLGRGNVDHVLVGPGGVFAIETKSHPGRIDVDRIYLRMLNQAYAEKKLIERITGLKAQALLVFSRAWLVGSVPAQRNGVTILPARMLQRYLSRRRPTMTSEAAAEIHGRLAQALSSAERPAP